MLDLILRNEYLNSPELLKDFCIGEHVDTSIRNLVLSIIKSNWDCFCERSVSRPVLDFELCIDICNATQLCFRKPNYRFHDWKVMNYNIIDLDGSGLITNCEGSWGLLPLLDIKPRQEDFTDVNVIIWKLCVSYWPLNTISRSFEYLIPRCNDSIENLGDSCGSLLMISLDDRNT